MKWQIKQQLPRIFRKYSITSFLSGAQTTGEDESFDCRDRVSYIPQFLTRMKTKNIISNIRNIVSVRNATNTIRYKPLHGDLESATD